MKLNRYIFTLILTVLAWGMSGERMYAQKEGSPESTFNALDYRFQKFDNTKVHFADSIKFRNKFYNIVGIGVAGEWERGGEVIEKSYTGYTTRFTLGYRITPVHAIETDLLHTFKPTGNAYGANINWVANLNNIATRRDGHNKFEALFIAGASYRYAEKSSAGINTGLRLQWNAGINAGFFIEPKVSVMTDPYSSRTFTTSPSISFGFTLRYHKPNYYLWDYLTPFAIKTNLLYDAATGVNVGIEAPIGRRFSLAFDWMCPWWSNYDAQKYLQIMQGTLEGRVWLGNRNRKDLLTGWFTGVMVGGGIYDLMFKPEIGYQGEYSTVGVIGGYAHRVNKSGTLRMEYELGLGWMGTDYRKYWWDGFDYALYAPSPQSWYFQWFGPVKAQISLVYMLKIRSKVGGRR